VARPRDVSEVDCGEPFARAAARVIEVRADELFEHSQGVLDLEETERVHDMRVATRRLRAAMEIFEPCFPRKRYRKALKGVKRLADALGARRDPDVEIAMVEGLLEEVRDEDRETLTGVLAGLRKEQRAANDELASFLSNRRLEKLHRRLGKLVRSAS
jgi:CHAD domain-containing protein